MLLTLLKRLVMKVQVYHLEGKVVRKAEYWCEVGPQGRSEALIPHYLHLHLHTSDLNSYETVIPRRGRPAV